VTRILTILLFLSTTTFGQLTSTERRGEHNIYNDAISRYLKRVTSIDKIKIDTLYLENNQVITDSLESAINATCLKVVDFPEIRNILSQEASVIVYKLFPLQFDKGQFSISIIPYSVTKTNTELNFAYSGGCRIIYFFDSKNHSFSFTRIECWGI